MMSASKIAEVIFQKKDHTLAQLTGINRATIATMRSRFRAGKDGGQGLSVNYHNWCLLAEACEIDTVVALIALLREKVEAEPVEGDKPPRQEVAALWRRVAEKISNGLNGLDTHLAESRGKIMSGARTLANFPSAFEEPFVVVTGDRREVSGNRLRMTPADFGILSGSPADLRYIFHLGLPRHQTELVTDKIFALAPYEELQQRFAEKTLVVIGSPASNHLARIINQYALHRFNLQPHIPAGQEEMIWQAWEVGTGRRKASEVAMTQKGQSVSGDGPGFFTAPNRTSSFNCDELKELLKNRASEMRWLYSAVFTGGLIDPSYHQLVRGLFKHDLNDFGVITLAQNPFRSENDGKYPAVFLAGYHLPGTCYALHHSIWLDPHTFFRKHPYGGVIQVNLQPSQQGPRQGTEYTFYERIENFQVKWDDESDYDFKTLREGLEKLSQDGPRSCYMTAEQARRALGFLQRLEDVGR